MKSKLKRTLFSVLTLGPGHSQFYAAETEVSPSSHIAVHNLPRPKAVIWSRSRDREVIQSPAVWAFTPPYGLFTMTVENRDNPNGNNGVFTLTAQYDPSNPQAWKMNKTSSTRHIGYQDFPDNEEFRFDFTPSWKGWKWNAEHSYVPKWGGQYHDNGATVSAKWTETHYWRPTEYSAWIPYTIDVEIVWLPQAETPYLVTPARTKIVTSDYGDWHDEDPYAYNNGDGSSESQYKIVAPRVLRGSTVFSVENHVFPSGEIDTTTHYWRVGADESPVFPLISPNNGYAWAALVEPTMELAVDADRDGQIKFPSEDSSNQTAFGTPYCFWLNDDIDRGHTVDENDWEEDDIGGSEHMGMRADSADGRVQSKRDLEDYTRLWISTQGLNDAVKDESNPLCLGLQWTDTGGTTPAIKIVKHIEPDGGTKYLTDETTAQQQSSGAAAAAVVGANTFATLVDASDTNGKFFVLPKSLFSELSESAPRTYLLFEGVQAGKGQLRLVILKKEGGAYTKIGGGPGVWIDLKSIEDFYERWTVGDTDGGVPWITASRKKVQLSAAGDAIGHTDGFAYAEVSPEEPKYVLFVHGWNMQPWEKNRFAETMFKRLYWQGYKGRMGIFCWPTTYAFEPPLSAILDGTNYDRGEWTAWRAAIPLKSLLVNLHDDYRDQVYVMAHSMGNVVMGEALRLAAEQGSGTLVNTYVASQAAVVAHCYDGGRSEDIAPAFGVLTSIGRIFDGSTFPQTPNVYPDWLAGNGRAVGTRVNFYNDNDYALWHDVWELNQFFKPDHPDGAKQPWHYSHEDDLGMPPNTYSSFIRFEHYDEMANPVGIHDLQLGSTASVEDRYEIMAFASEARTKAVGATAGSLTLDRSLNLQSIWPVDNQSVKLHDGLNYSAHKWHSAQFRSTNMRQKGYWRALLGDQGFNLLPTP